MNKKTLKIAGWALGLSMAVAGIGVAVGASHLGKNNEPLQVKADSSNGESESVTFKKAGSDSSTAVTTATAFTNLVDDANNTLIASCTSTSKAYAGTNGIKFGTGSATGNITFSINDGCQNFVTDVVITSTQYSSDSGKLKITLYDDEGTAYGTTKQITPGATGADATYSFASASTVTAIKIETTSKRAYLGSITFNYEMPKSYTVTYDKNSSGATGSMSDANSPYLSGTTVTVLDNGFTPPENMMFDHWDTKADDSGTDYDPGDKFSISANTTLYAQWVDAPTEPWINLNLTSGESSYKGENVTITATSGNLVGSGIEWSVVSGSVTDITSSNSAFSGKLASTGSVTIKAKDNGGDLYETVTITVSAVTLSLNKGSTSIQQGKSETLVPTVNYGSIIWTSSNDSAATVSNGVVSVPSGASAGDTATITATSAVDSSVTATCTVTVLESSAQSTWNLSVASYDENPTEANVQWSSSAAIMTLEKGTSSTATNNYLGGDANKRTSSRFYSNQILTITPGIGLSIDSIVFAATSESYASAFKGSTWTNASAAVTSSTVTVTPADGTSAISAKVGGTCGFTKVDVYYSENWCDTFLETFTCSGVTVGTPNGSITVANPTKVWAKFESSFAALKLAKQNSLKTTEANESGNALEQALARYDLVVKKYGTGTYNDFIGRFEDGGAN